MTFGSKLDGFIYTGGQPTQAQFSGLGKDGFKRVIDLRPPTEDRGFDEAREAAQQHMDYVCLPIATAADLTLVNVKHFDALLGTPPTPMTLVHCGSSNRVGALFALRAAWLNGATPEAALAIGRAAGLTGLETAVRSAIVKGPASQ